MWLILGCAPDPCLSFVGDVSLSRGVADEIARHGTPWKGGTGPWVGNLEGTLAEGTCTDPICLGISRETLGILRQSPFVALSVANNHTFDYGPAAHAATSSALREMDITPLEGGTPTLLTLAGREWAFVALDFASYGDSLADARLAVMKARALTPWVVAVPHWGLESVVQLGPGQEATGEMLAEWGATLVVGSGSHTVQSELCRASSVIYYGLGNHLFDQSPQASRTGGLVECCPTRAGVDCTSRTTHREENRTFPVLDPGVGPTCHLPTPAAIDPAWQAHPWRDHFRSVQPFREVNGWFTLHDHWSEIDREEGLRPYVFRMNADGSFTDVWRGSSLARPLLAARLFDWNGEERLCAIHRGDSFLSPNPSTTERVYVVYKWNGFGFSAVADPGAQAVCERF